MVTHSNDVDVCPFVLQRSGRWECVLGVHVRPSVRQNDDDVLDAVSVAGVGHKQSVTCQTQSILGVGSPARGWEGKGVEDILFVLVCVKLQKQ